MPKCDVIKFSFLHFSIFVIIFQQNMMKNPHTPNLTWIGSWGPEIWPHEYLISPIENSVNSGVIFFFSGWCCHGVTTQVFYSENITYKYHMQSWIWIWYALITSCSDYKTDVVWNQPLLRAVIGLSKAAEEAWAQQNLAGRKRGKRRRRPSKNNQKTAITDFPKVVSPSMNERWKNTVMQSLKCKLMHHKAEYKLEHDIIPRDLLTIKTPTPPHPKQKPSPLPSTNIH